MVNLPSSFKIIEEKDNYGVFEISGLYPGYGVTLGNLFRRVLLSSLNGAAVTNFKIKGISHEFSIIPHITENVLDIMLNLKQLRVKMFTDEPQTLELKIKGEKKIKAQDIKSNSLVEIANPNLHLMTLNHKNAEIDMEITVEKGLGYSQVEDRKKGKLSIGEIAMDAIFSPIVKVNFKVENMRVGNRTDFHKLILIIETDNSLTPKEALTESIKIIKEQIEIIENWVNDSLPTKSSKEDTKKQINNDEEKSFFLNEKKPPKDISVNDLGFSLRTQNVLIENGVKTLAGLLRLKEKSLLNMEGLGEKSIDEIKKVLQNLEYNLK